MKRVILSVIGLVGILGFSGCSSQPKVQTRSSYNPGVQSMLHATNFGGIRKICVDGVMYITSYNGMTPAIDNKNGRNVSCQVDEYGRVIATGTFGKK